VDIRASMYVMAIIVVRELGIIRLVVGHEIYNITFGIVTQALGRIIQILIIFGKIICQMVFLVIDNYDLLLGLDFLMKIRVKWMWKNESSKLVMDLRWK
jgi:hypothetical protein